jgi:ATP-dependent DNA helicase RecG
MIDLRELMFRESEQVEWKENVADVNDVVRTLVAFANDLANLGGGRVVCGAAEGKDEHGFPRVRLIGMTAERIGEVRGKVIARCQANVAPSIAPIVDEVPTDDPTRRVLVFTMIATGRAHVFRDGDQSTYPVRVDSSTREARNGVLMRLLASKGEVQPWDERLAAEATIDDLDLLALRDTLVRMGTWDLTRGVEPWLNPAVSLSTFMPSLCGREPLTGVIRPRNFAILLFGREPQRFVPGAISSFSRYPGTDRAEPYNERMLLDGTIVAQARQLIDRLAVEAITVTDKSTGGAENVQKYPLRALQEAVINALVHRDYTERDPVRVVAYTDRVEIWSPGGLDPRVSREAFLRSEAHPVWRNRALAWVFIKLKLAQSEGQGISAIQRSLETEGSSRATFELTDSSVACQLPAHPRHSRVRSLLQIEADISGGRVSEALITLEALLRQDPWNARILGLLAEVVRLTGDPSPATRILSAHGEALVRIPPVARLALARAIIASHDSEAHRDLTLALLADLTTDRFTLAELRDYVSLLVALRTEAAALAVLRAAWARDPALAKDPALLYWSGHAWLQRLKRGDLSGDLEANAARDLRSAIEHGAVGWIKERAEAELRYMQDHGRWA